MDAMQILVIILSAFLALFLLLGIVLVVMMIKVTQQIKQLSVKANDAVSKVGVITGNVAKFTNPAVMFDVVKNTITRLKNDKTK